MTRRCPMPLARLRAPLRLAAGGLGPCHPRAMSVPWRPGLLPIRCAAGTRMGSRLPGSGTLGSAAQGPWSLAREPAHRRLRWSPGTKPGPCSTSESSACSAVPRGGPVLASTRGPCCPSPRLHRRRNTDCPWVRLVWPGRQRNWAYHGSRLRHWMRRFATPGRCGTWRTGCCCSTGCVGTVCRIRSSTRPRCHGCIGPPCGCRARRSGTLGIAETPKPP